MIRSATKIQHNLELVSYYQAPNNQAGKVSISKCYTFYSQFSISKSSYNIGDYVVKKLLISQKIDHCLFTKFNDIMPAMKLYRSI